jgi:hypothetical protein
MMFDENDGKDAPILRTSVPKDLARAIAALDRNGIPYHIESENTGGWKFPPHVHEMLVDGRNEAAAIDAVADIPTEVALPVASNEGVERSTASLARVHAFAFLAAIVILLAGFLWQRFS